MVDELVCIGGPVDGGSCLVENGMPVVTMPVVTKLFRWEAWGAKRPDEPVVGETVAYRREKIKAGGVEVEFLVYAPMSTIDAVKKLLEDHRS